jgi:hypothetical protein
MVAPTPSLTFGTVNVNLGDLPQDVRDIKDAVVAGDSMAQPLVQNAQQIHDAVVAEDSKARPLVQNVQQIHDAVVAQDRDAQPLAQNVRDIRDLVLKLWWLDQLRPLATGSAPTGFLGEAASSLGIGAQQLAEADAAVSHMKRLAESIHEQFLLSESEYGIIAEIVTPIAKKHIGSS